jgi:hypothetical protein
MAVSDLDIVNGALDKLGVAPISAIGEDSVAGGLAARTYAHKRDELLQSHPWGFALKRVALVLLAPPPDAESGFLYRYQLPADYLRVVEVIDAQADEWVVEGRELWTSIVGPLWIRYIRQVTQPGLFSAGFGAALEHALAVDWAETLTKSTTLAARVAGAADRKVREARSFDGQESSIQVIESHGWVTER